MNAQTEDQFTLPLAAYNLPHAAFMNLMPPLPLFDNIP